VGRLVREKGVDLLLRACQSLDRPWTLTIVGDGAEEESLRQLATDLKIADRVLFRSPVPSGQIPSILGSIDVLVLPSRSLPNWREQFGRVLMEAMACEVPVVGSTCGEIPRVIGDGGLVFSEDDAVALGHRLRALQADLDLRRHLGRRGRERVLTQFTYRRIAERTRETYRDLLDPST
jgi:glycosyltransferase involved in cell wall biosynthesis